MLLIDDDEVEAEIAKDLGRMNRRGLEKASHQHAAGLETLPESGDGRLAGFA
jgi:hypothetical protein